MLKINKKKYHFIGIALIMIAMPLLTSINLLIKNVQNAAAEDVAGIESLEDIFYDKGSNKDQTVSYDKPTGEEIDTVVTLEGIENALGPMIVGPSCYTLSASTTTTGKLTLKASCLERLDGSKSYKLIIRANNETTKFNLIIRSSELISCNDTPDSPICQAPSGNTNTNDNDNSGATTDTTTNDKDNDSSKTNEETTTEDEKKQIKRYPITDDEQTLDDTSGLIVKSAGPTDKFVQLLLDGKPLTKDVDYTITTDSKTGETIITIDHTLAASMEEGEHDITIEYEDGISEAIITKKGDKFSIENVEVEEEEKDIPVPNTSGLTPDTGSATNNNEGIINNAPFIIIGIVLLSSSLIYIIYRNSKKISFDKR